MMVKDPSLAEISQLLQNDAILPPSNARKWLFVAPTTLEYSLNESLF